MGALAAVHTDLSERFKTFSQENLAALKRVNDVTRKLTSMGVRVVATDTCVMGTAKRPSISIETPSDTALLQALLVAGSGYTKRRIDGVKVAITVVDGVDVRWPVAEEAA